MNEYEQETKRLDSWYEKGKQLAGQGNSTVWETADWLLEAASFGQLERCCYKKAAAILSLSVGTCRNYTSVAKAFPTAKRHVDVTFAHHQAVAALPESEQERLLGAAAGAQWTVGKLRGEVRKVDNGVPRKRHQYLSSAHPRQYESNAHERIQKWWMALQRLASTDEIAEALVGLQLVPLQSRPPVSGALRSMGARLIALAEQIETLPPPNAAPDEPNIATAVVEGDADWDAAMGAPEQSPTADLVEEKTQACV